ncbi:MAG: hypothetical protein ACJ8AW_05155, partial [Rhodopila sp.]
GICHLSHTKARKPGSIAPRDTAGPANAAENHRKSPILAVLIPWELFSTRWFSATSGMGKPSVTDFNFHQFGMILRTSAELLQS